MTTPKVGRFTNILHNTYIYIELQTRVVPKINLIKIFHSQLNIFIIFITFLSGDFQCVCRHNDESVKHSNE